MPNGSSLSQTKIGFALCAATVVAMPPLAAKKSKRGALKVSLTLLKSKDNLVADGKS
jgi:hypothetical protein